MYEPINLTYHWEEIDLEEADTTYRLEHLANGPLSDNDEPVSSHGQLPTPQSQQQSQQAIAQAPTTFKRPQKANQKRDTTLNLIVFNHGRAGLCGPRSASRFMAWWSSITLQFSSKFLAAQGMEKGHKSLRSYAYAGDYYDCRDERSIPVQSLLLFMASRQ
ncbi:hypothetical protein N7528_004142 [Penicillium herquei]|nr:hypothetical protein N7528_004142 [Penicillium herquei]